MRPAAKLDQALPTDEQIDKHGRARWQRFLRGFMGIVKDLENEAERRSPQTGRTEDLNIAS